jgi:hypothetical protein
VVFLATPSKLGGLILGFIKSKSSANGIAISISKSEITEKFDRSGHLEGCFTRKVEVAVRCLPSAARCLLQAAS